jgi:site-specific DNA-methyltransferase (adenine-specific)
MKITNEDNMELMARYEDNHFDLAIVDPPYGINIQNAGGSPQHLGFKNYTKKNWDNETPNQKYFDELKRVSKNQIIWGANYFVEYLSQGTMGWIFWYKGQQGLTMSDGEIAYSSFQKATRMININRCQIKIDGAIHPTQKPVKLYEWLLMNYAKEGDKILDTHLGSGSIAIACHNLGFDLTACELDKEYFEASLKRLKQHQSQLRLI